MKNGKRISKVIIKQMTDTDPDTSYLGEYSNKAETDYARMESLHRGNWFYMGLRAEAEVFVPCGQSSISQGITSGGLYGIESDSGKDYIAEVEQEELAELRKQLSALGFSKRAIATACKGVERTEE